MCEKCNDKVNKAMSRLTDRASTVNKESEEFKSIEAASQVFEAFTHRIQAYEKELNHAADKIKSLQSMIEGRA